MYKNQFLCWENRFFFFLLPVHHCCSHMVLSLLAHSRLEWTFKWITFIRLLQFTDNHPFKEVFILFAIYMILSWILRFSIVFIYPKNISRIRVAKSQYLMQKFIFYNNLNFAATLTFPFKILWLYSIQISVGCSENAHIIAMASYFKCPALQTE